MDTVFGLNFFVFCIMVLVVVMYFTKGVRDEGFQGWKEEKEEEKKEPFFGTSPGTMVQLEASRPPVDAHPDQDARDIMNMPESGSFDTHYASS